MTWFVRPMELEDIAEVAQIERESFPEPWPATNFRRELTSNSLSHYFVACDVLSEDKRQVSELEIEDGNVRSPRPQFERLRASFARLLSRKTAAVARSQLILGFAGIWFMVDEAHLANIAVREVNRQRGVGEHLLISIIKLAIERDAQFITLEVRASNEAAQALYKKYSFVEVGIRRGYYSDNKEDAVLMTMEGITSVPFYDDFQRLRLAYAQKWGITV